MVSLTSGQQKEKGVRCSYKSNRCLVVKDLKRVKLKTMLRSVLEGQFTKAISMIQWYYYPGARLQL